MPNAKLTSKNQLTLPAGLIGAKATAFGAFTSAASDRRTFPTVIPA
jgi:hypothetical protein